MIAPCSYRRGEKDEGEEAGAGTYLIQSKRLGDWNTLGGGVSYAWVRAVIAQRILTDGLEEAAHDRLLPAPPPQRLRPR